MNQTPQEKQQPAPRPSVPPATLEETGRNKGDGKKKKANFAPNQIPAPTPEKSVSRRLD
jgi:hypothetical protein